MPDFRIMLSQARPKITIPFSIGHLNPIPHRYRLGRWRHKIRGRYDPDDVTAIRTSFNPLETIARVRSHRWSWYDLQYLFLFIVAVSSLAIAPMHVAFKIAFSALLTILLLLPITSQFFWPGVAIWTYLIYYFGSRFIPVEARPHIWVKVLPALENILYGANLSNILSAHTNAVLDVLAWLPYGILHFSLPFFVTVILFVFASPGTAPVWARAFGWMNMVGVTIQLVFPCTPPWYETVHGLDVPAYYGMEGSPAGLARIDKLFGFDMYTTNFTKGPLPFGAFPSLHAGNATLEAFFLSYCFPRFRPLFFAYVAWVWWATMYLSHHYAVDLVGGSLLAAACFYYSRAWWLPRRQEGKSNRWDYEWIERGEHHASADEEYGLHAYDKLGNRRYSAESDEWTLGSSSGFSSSGASASGSMSPVLNDWESDLSRDELHEAIER